MHLMIDLETMSTRSDAAITQVGAVMFDPNKGTLGAEFCEHVKLTEDSGHMDPGTVRWWLGQSDAARQALLAGQQMAPALHEVLDSFSTFVRRERPAAIWSHGATFDLPIMEAAFRRCDMTVPWSYYSNRDTRTLFDIVGKKIQELATREGVHHNALDDAKTQAMAVIAAYKILASQGLTYVAFDGSQK